MILTNFVRIQLIIFAIITVVAVGLMGIKYMQIPSLLGIGHYTVRVELPTTGGVYKTANVTYRGVTVGGVTSVDLDDHGGVVVTLRLSSQWKIPADSDADVHSRSAIGEQYIDLVPQSEGKPYLSEGAVIPLDRTSVPQDIGPMIDNVNTSLQTLQPGQLSGVIDEAFEAFNGTDQSLQRFLSASHELATGVEQTLDPLSQLIDDANPLLQSQVDSATSIGRWARNVSDISTQLRDRDETFRQLMVTGYEAADHANAFFQQIKPTVPVLLSNLVSLGQVAVTYNASLEQVIVILPQGISAEQSVTVPNLGTTNRGSFAFNLNLNLPEPCTTGFLPASERRDASAVDAPPRPSEALYCAIPQDDKNAVRGSRNLPCMDNPGKRAPTVEMCRSEDEYVPQGDNPYIGAPVPAPNSAGAPSHGGTIAQGSYNERSGEYQGPDGNTYVQSDVARDQQGRPPGLDNLFHPAG